MMFAIAGPSVLLLLLALPSSCSQEKEYITLKVTCTTMINVTATGVDMPDAYVCKNTKVTWIDNGHTFSVGFKNGQCPFVSCKEIDNRYPTAGPTKNGVTQGTIYDYAIIIDGQVFDPHIIPGG